MTITSDNWTLTRCNMQKTSDFGVATEKNILKPAHAKTRIGYMLERTLHVVTQC